MRCPDCGGKLWWYLGVQGDRDDVLPNGPVILADGNTQYDPINDKTGPMFTRESWARARPILMDACPQPRWGIMHRGKHRDRLESTIAIMRTIAEGLPWAIVNSGGVATLLYLDWCSYQVGMLSAGIARLSPIMKHIHNPEKCKVWLDEIKNIDATHPAVWAYRSIFEGVPEAEALQISRVPTPCPFVGIKECLLGPNCCPHSEDTREMAFYTSCGAITDVLGGKCTSS